MWWLQQGLSVLPVALVTWTAATFIFAYITAVTLRHVDPLVPYISNTEHQWYFYRYLSTKLTIKYMQMSCVKFWHAALLRHETLTLFVTTGIATTYVRYKQVQALLGQEEKTLHKTNQLGLVLGTISSSGMCVVANFQKTTLFAMHIVGAVMTFGIGALYIVVQSLLSFHMQPHLHSKTIFSIRLSIAVWTIAMFVSSVVMYSSLPGVDVAQKLHWSPGEMGYTAHIISTISEWSLAFSFISFFFTYIRDFQ
ncbi:hypothetical protein CRUP_011967, partial [Coryphaenoides rupestris]